MLRSVIVKSFGWLFRWLASFKKRRPAVRLQVAEKSDLAKVAQVIRSQPSNRHLVIIKWLSSGRELSTLLKNDKLRIAFFTAEQTFAARQALLLAFTLGDLDVLIASKAMMVGWFFHGPRATTLHADFYVTEELKKQFLGRRRGPFHNTEVNLPVNYRYDTRLRRN